MAKIKKVLFVGVCVVLFCVALRVVQYDDRHAVVCSVTEQTVKFETESGLVYEWKCSVNEHYEVGEDVVLTMFDYEDSNPRNDKIIKVRRK